MFHVGQFQLPRAPVRPEEFRLPVSHTHTMLGYGFTIVKNLMCRSVELLMKLVLLPLSLASKKLRPPKTHSRSGYRQLYCNSYRHKRDLCCFNPYQMLGLKNVGRRGWSGFEFLNTRSASIWMNSDINFFLK